MTPRRKNHSNEDYPARVEQLFTYNEEDIPEWMPLLSPRACTQKASKDEIEAAQEAAWPTDVWPGYVLPVKNEDRRYIYVTFVSETTESHVPAEAMITALMCIKMHMTVNGVTSLAIPRISGYGNRQLFEQAKKVFRNAFNMDISLYHGTRPKMSVTLNKPELAKMAEALDESEQELKATGMAQDVVIYMPEPLAAQAEGDGQKKEPENQAAEPDALALAIEEALNDII